MKRTLATIAALLVAASVGGCNLNLAISAAPQAWIDAPLDGMVLPLAPYMLVAHTSGPSGVSQIEFSVNGSVLGTAQGSGTIFHAQQNWTPAAPGQYVIRARGMSTGGAWSDYALVTVTVQGSVPNPPPPTLQAVPQTSPAQQGAPQLASPTPLQAAVFTPTPASQVPVIGLNENANCRRGAGMDYEVLTSLLKGQSVPILAKSEDGYWWLVKIPTGELCWIAGSTGAASGNPNAVPVATSKPLPPTAPPQGCYVFDQQQQPVCTVPCPPNANPGGDCTP